MNNYKIKDDQGLAPKNPLRLMFCDKTKLLQLEEMPDRNDIYRDYDHFSSASSTNVSHLKSIANDINKLEDKNKTILEVGCNDATLLRELGSHMRRDRSRYLENSRNRGDDTLRSFNNLTEEITNSNI